MATQYDSIYLEQTKEFIESDSFAMSFMILDEKKDIVSDLSSFKFESEITDDAQELKKKDANYDEGSDDEIKVNGNTVTIYVDTDDTKDWEGYFRISLMMTHKTSGDRYTVYDDEIRIKDTNTD